MMITNALLCMLLLRQISTMVLDRLIRSQCRLGMKLLSLHLRVIEVSFGAWPFSIQVYKINIRYWGLRARIKMSVSDLNLL